MASKPAVLTLATLELIPAGVVVDGSVAELRYEGGIVTAEIRIPGPPVP
jgi:hypothetical protein